MLVVVISKRPLGLRTRENSDMALISFSICSMVLLQVTVAKEAFLNGM